MAPRLDLADQGRPTGDDNREPDWLKQERGYRPHTQPGELYDLGHDLAERRNLYAERPEVVRELKALLEQYKRDGRSTPGPPQQNDVPLGADQPAGKAAAKD